MRSIYIFNFFFSLPLLFSSLTFAQDTFSIVAADSATREVGSAGASCVDLYLAGFTDPSFLGDLLPDTGAINSQASYLPANQNNARARMRAGDTPAQIITWLNANDVSSNPAVRQYGIVGFSGVNTSAAAHTGTSCITYKNHITGSLNGIYYSIQGNILLGQEVLDSMESRFRNAEGDLACRLMEALQGAKMVGADTRCAPDGTSSLFSFLKVAQPTDAYGSPSFIVTVRTHDNSMIEPIDSLQTLFDLAHACGPAGIGGVGNETGLQLFPNPAKDQLSIQIDNSFIGLDYSIVDPLGKIILSGKIRDKKMVIDINTLSSGIYFLQIKNSSVKFVKN